MVIVAVGEYVSVGVGEMVGVNVIVWVREGVTVRVEVLVKVCVKVGVDVDVRVYVIEGVGSISPAIPLVMIPVQPQYTAIKDIIKEVLNLLGILFMLFLSSPPKLKQKELHPN